MKFAKALVALFILAGSVSAQNAPTKRPNILFIICDDLNTSSLPAYGNKIVKAPNIDRLASMGERFDRSYCQWPLCLPSRNSFLSGRRPDAQFARDGLLSEVRPDVVFLPQYFRNHGYYTARVGKIMHVRTVFRGLPVKDLENPNCWDISEVGGTDIDPCGYSVLFSSIPKGLEAHPELQSITDHHELFNKALNPSYDYWMEMAALNVPDEACTDGHIARRISDLMESASKGDKPFLMAAGFRRPHLLWVAPKKYFDMYDWHDIPLPQEPDHLNDVPKMALTRGAPDMTDEQRKKAIASYYACVSEVDAQIGVLLATMDRLKLWDSTIVVLTSDHGWHLYEHGLWGKVTLFDVAARVPLIIVAPGVTKAGATCSRTVEMLDFYPTFAELAGLPPPEKVDGQSIVPLLKDPQSPRDRPAFSVLRRGAKWGKAVYTQKYRYTEYANDAAAGAELYDLEADPHEYHNLAKDPAHAQTVEELKKLLYSTVNLKDQAPTTEGSTD